MSWVDGFSQEQLYQGHMDFNWIDDKMHKTIASHHGNKIAHYEIVNLFKVKNSTLWNRYSEKRSSIAHEMKGMVPEKRLFHGTPQADAIVKNGFDISHANPQGMFGKGIYFADLSSKSNQYTVQGYNGGCQPHNDSLCTKCTRKMLVCRVALGLQFDAQVPMNGIDKPPQGYHSVVAQPKPGFLCYPEYVIYNSNQVYPGYLVEYKISF